MVFPKIYHADPSRGVRRIHLPNEGIKFSQVTQAFIQVCVDVIPVNYKKRILYLAPRISQPMAGWWWIGGKRFPGELPNEAIKRRFQEETSLNFQAEKFCHFKRYDLICPQIH